MMHRTDTPKKIRVTCSEFEMSRSLSHHADAVRFEVARPNGLPCNIGSDC
jgi:hypothetical protein